MAELGPIVSRLRSQVSRAEPVLFIGAGFSLEARDSLGALLPSSAALAQEFWQLAFPSEAFDVSTRLGDAFNAAKVRNPKALAQLIQRRLSVNSEALPDFYRLWFSVPWASCYTLNIDDLELAVSRRFQLERGISAVSATSDQRQGTEAAGHLEVIHLNGALWDTVDDLTFSATDYGYRLTRPDQWLTRCLTDILVRPVIFVGTELDESTLWQHLEYRKNKGGRDTREMRPGSILVSPSLNVARRLLLREFNIDWLPMTSRQFAEQVLEQLHYSMTQGHSALREKLGTEQRTAVPNLVSDLASVNPNKKTDYLIGQEPHWADLQSGRAIRREVDEGVLERANAILASDHVGRPLVLTGTAGSGKSTSLMRLGLELSGQGVATFWIDESSNIEPYKLRDIVRSSEDPVAILIDDADLFGRMASAWARELSQIRPKVLVALATRSSKVDGLLDRDTLGGLEPYEITMPNLTDSDIDDLISVLDGENRLGILKNRSHEERVRAFSNQAQAGRQLLVAMYQATSGQRFAEKAVDEFSELQAQQRLLYGIICFVSSQRYTLSLEELLTAVNNRDNGTLNNVEQMVSRNILIRGDRYTGYAARHRVLAEHVVTSQPFRTQIRPILEGVYFGLATHLRPNQPRSARQWRRWIWFIRHEFLLHFAAPEDGREIYAILEPILDWDYHYWLQRGSLEVEDGDLGLAENFLGQAQSLAPDDRYVKTERAYLLLKKAASYPRHPVAHDWFSDGFSSLKLQIDDRGQSDPYPYHVLGSQTLSWVRSGAVPTLEKRNILRETLDIVKAGMAQHPRSEELRRLSQDVQTEWLMTTVE